jgi:hypothetical protein
MTAADTPLPEPGPPGPPDTLGPGESPSLSGIPGWSVPPTLVGVSGAGRGGVPETATPLG